MRKLAALFTDGIIVRMQNETEASRIDLSVTLLPQMVHYLSSLKIDIESLFRSNGLDPEILETLDARIPGETYISIQEEAARIANDEYFGLHMGEFAEAGSYSIVGYMMMNCRTLGEAFEKAGRYSRIIGTLIQASAHIRFRKIKIVY